MPEWIQRSLCFVGGMALVGWVWCCVWQQQRSGFPQSAALRHQGDQWTIIIGHDEKMTWRSSRQHANGCTVITYRTDEEAREAAHRAQKAAWDKQ